MDRLRILLQYLRKAKLIMNSNEPPRPITVKDLTVRDLLRVFNQDPEKAIIRINEQTFEMPGGRRGRYHPISLNDRITATEWSDGFIRLTDERGGVIAERLTGERRPIIGLRMWQRLLSSRKGATRKNVTSVVAKWEQVNRNEWELWSKDDNLLVALFRDRPQRMTTRGYVIDPSQGWRWTVVLPGKPSITINPKNLRDAKRQAEALVR